MERNKEDNVIEDEKGNTFRFLCTENSIYDDPSIFMVSWWGIDSYLNSKQIQMSDIEIMNAAFGSSGSFGSRFRSKCIVHNIYTGRRSNFCSKPTPINVPVHKQ